MPGEEWLNLLLPGRFYIMTNILIQVVKHDRRNVYNFWIVFQQGIVFVSMTPIILKLLNLRFITFVQPIGRIIISEICR